MLLILVKLLLFLFLFLHMVLFHVLVAAAAADAFAEHLLRGLHFSTRLVEVTPLDSLRTQVIA